MGRAVVTAAGALLLLACYTAPTLDVGRVPAGVIAETHLTYYDVNAASLSEIRLALARDGPSTGGRRWHAVTTWHLRYEYQARKLGGGSGCEARHVRVRVETAVTFPRWNPTAQPDSALLAWWQQYNAGLAEHERGHAMLAVQSAGDMARQLEGTQSPCGQMDEDLSAKFNRLLAALNARETDYDLTTRHGATQIQQVRRLSEP